MIKKLKEFFSVLNSRAKIELFSLQLFMALAALIELTTLVFVGFFMRIISDPSVVNSSKFLEEVYKISGATTDGDFLFFFGAFGLFILFVSALSSFVIVWWISTYSQRLGANFASMLYSYYIKKDYSFHLNHAGSKLSSNVAQETQRLTNMVILPFLNLFAKAIQAVVLVGVIFYVSPQITAYLMGGLIFLYLCTYFIIAKKIKKNGDALVKLNHDRFRYLHEGFNGIKEIIVFGRTSHFSKSFSKTNNAFGKALGENLAIGQVPRYVLEFLAYGGIMFVVMISVVKSENNVSNILSTLAVMGFASLKLLPAIQLCYNSFVSIRANISSWELLKKDLNASNQVSYEVVGSQDMMVMSEGFSINGYSFKYDELNENQKLTLDDISIEFPINKTIGIVGVSGSGKSTLLDCILGLLLPSKGSLLVDGIKIEKNNNRRTWLDNIGYVPQKIFLCDASIRENIAFGIDPNLIDDSKVENAARLSSCDEFISELPEKYQTIVGEGGCRLSGGQCQRLGIARALYSNPQIVIFDEATSALDGLSEHSVMKAIREMSLMKTVIIVAHRLATVRDCDIIYVLENGKIVEEGSYDELINKRSAFYRMAKIDGDYN